MVERPVGLQCGNLDCRESFCVWSRGFGACESLKEEDWRGRDGGGIRLFKMEINSLGPCFEGLGTAPITVHKPDNF